MRDQPDFTDYFRDALESHQPQARFDEIETRSCASDDYDGTEYKFHGTYIPIRPIIGVVAAKENFGIESISYIDEGEPHLNVFVADLRENQSHPAFTE